MKGHCLYDSIIPPGAACKDGGLGGGYVVEMLEFIVFNKQQPRADMYDVLSASMEWTTNKVHTVMTTQLIKIYMQKRRLYILTKPHSKAIAYFKSY